MRNDDSTIATLETLETESYAVVPNGAALSMAASPRFATVGLDATAPAVQQGVQSLGANNYAPSPGLPGVATHKMAITEFCVSLKAGDIPDNEEARAPVDIIVALDKSGSMATRGKLDLCKKTLGVLLRQLLPQDRFGLITYSNSAQVAVPIQRMTPQHKETATKAIQKLFASGGTNMSAGIGQTAQEMRTVSEPNPVQTVFLLTDGHANSGISGVPGLVNLVRNCLGAGTNQPPSQPAVAVEPGFFRSLSLRRSAQQQNQQQTQAPNPVVVTQPPAPSANAAPAVTLHTFGYGSDHNGTLLREMASATEGGSYYFIEEDKDVGTAFGDALGGVLSMVAQNATVTLDVPSVAKAMGVEIVQVHHDQAVRRENGSYTVPLGDFYAEETRDLVVSIRLATPGQLNAQPIPHATASLSYTDTLESRLVQGGTETVSISRPAGTELSEENAHVAAQAFRVQAAKDMEEAEKMASAGQYGAAKAKFRQMKVAYAACSPMVQAMPQSTEVFADADDMEMMMDDETSYKKSGQATLNMKMRAHKTQRAAVSKASAPSPSYARGKKRAAYASKFSEH